MTEVRSQKSEVRTRIEIVPYEPAHLEALQVQAVQDGERMIAEPEGLEGRLSRTVLCGGELAACAGIAPVWPGRAFAWAFTWLLLNFLEMYVIWMGRTRQRLILTPPIRLSIFFPSRKM